MKYAITLFATLVIALAVARVTHKSTPAEWRGAINYTKAAAPALYASPAARPRGPSVPRPPQLASTGPREQPSIHFVERADSSLAQSEELSQAVAKIDKDLPVVRVY